MSRHFVRALLVSMFTGALVVSSSAWAQTSRAEEEAGDVSEVDKDASGPLRDRIPPVSGHLFLMDGRFEISPALGLSIRDAFFTKVFLGAALTYHFTETLGVSLRAAYSPNVISGTAQICTTPDPTAIPADPGGCRSPTFDELTKENGQLQNRAYGLITLVSSIDFQWAPIYGKLSLIAEKFLHFNMYAVAGPAVVMYGPLNTFTVGGNVGVGFRFVVNRWITVRAELRDLIYNEVGFPPDANGLPNSVRNQLGFDLGVSFFLPTVFEERRP